MIRPLLDRLYGLSLSLSALCYVLIAGMVLIQITGRLLDKAALSFGAEPLGINVPSIAELGAFLFAAAAMLALAGTLHAGGHVRVTMLSRALPAALARGLTALVLLMALGLAGFATWYFALQSYDSYAYDSVSYGIIRVPLWLPQGAMTLGLGLLCVALLDALITELRGGTAPFRAAEDARAQTAEESV